MNYNEQDALKFAGKLALAAEHLLQSNMSSLPEKLDELKKSSFTL